MENERPRMYNYLLSLRLECAMVMDGKNVSPKLLKDCRLFVKALKFTSHSLPQLTTDASPFWRQTASFTLSDLSYIFIMTAVNSRVLSISRWELMRPVWSLMKINKLALKMAPWRTPVIIEKDLDELLSNSTFITEFFKQGMDQIKY